jgi:hypothetical protein
MGFRLRRSAEKQEAPSAVAVGTISRTIICLTLVLSMVGCSDGHDENEANQKGVGAECVANDECLNGIPDGADIVADVEYQQCLTEFSGGYCGLKDCTAHSDCPEGSLCVVHDNGSHYCFLTCKDKADCNIHRSSTNEANCVSSIVFIDESVTSKACVPPSGN